MAFSTPKDQNNVSAAFGVSSVDGVTPTPFYVNPTTHAVYVDAASLYGTLDTRYLPLSGGTLSGTLNSLSVIPTVDSASDLGSSSKYFANGYLDKIYLNSTASLDGSVAGQSLFTGNLRINGRLGIGKNPASNAAIDIQVSGLNDQYINFVNTQQGYGAYFKIQSNSGYSSMLLVNDSHQWQFGQFGGTSFSIRDISNSTTFLTLTSTGILILHTGSITTDSNANLSLVPNGTGYTIIGDAGTTSHTFNTNDDLLVSGRLEVDGVAYLDGSATIAGITTLGAPATLKAYTVATLPTGVQGHVCFVTDALAPTFLATIVGGGAIVTPVFYNGTNWVGF